jgi:hypothetical protein
MCVWHTPALYLDSTSRPSPPTLPWKKHGWIADFQMIDARYGVLLAQRIISPAHCGATIAEQLFLACSSMAIHFHAVIAVQLKTSMA